ncbi:zinc finger protein 410 [Stylonychia lemnae]|uniref:Zinc finger protein 410 n=1 Tax=Stylonychia lemnae TaxID=5949 RepID=A0A078AKW7_STYLE|nr:zinc finger protein 410 [Stylonychia lemnae]|eukprot:CDW81463.1 zinc finger protein 410 [Stylonychia lemnae]
MVPQFSNNNFQAPSHLGFNFQQPLLQSVINYNMPGNLSTLPPKLQPNYYPLIQAKQLPLNQFQPKIIFHQTQSQSKIEDNRLNDTQFIMGQSSVACTQNNMTSLSCMKDISINEKQKDEKNNFVDISANNSTLSSDDTVESNIKKRLGLSLTCQIIFEDGHDVDLAQLQNLHIPSIKTFKYVKFYKEHSKRWIQIFLCEFQNCQKSFKKWHNLFDHLRSHTQEKPFICPVDGCSQPFTQRSNLNKHMKIHKNKCYLKCSECKKFFTKSKLMTHFLGHQGICEEESCGLDEDDYTINRLEIEQNIQVKLNEGSQSNQEQQQN